MRRQVPATQETLEVPQAQFTDKVIDVPVMSQRQDPTVQTQLGDRGSTHHGRRGCETPTAEVDIQVTTVMKQVKGSS